jgi:hypothetical protein
MVELEEQNRTLSDWLKLVLPRVIRIVLWILILFGGVTLMTMITESAFGGVIPLEFSAFSSYLIAFIGFEIVIQLLRDTIFQHIFTVARTIMYMILIVFESNAGIIQLTPSSIGLPPGTNLVLTVNITTVINIFLLLSLLSVVKNMLQAIEFMQRKSEEPMIPPELS